MRQTFACIKEGDLFRTDELGFVVVTKVMSTWREIEHRYVVFVKRLAPRR